MRGASLDKSMSHYLVEQLRGKSNIAVALGSEVTAAHGGQPYNAPYVATKAGLAALTKNAAHAHRWDRIRINGLNIGWTDTPAEDRLQRRSHGLIVHLSLLRAHVSWP